MTNNGFTKAAQDLAFATGVELWGNMTTDRLMIGEIGKPSVADGDYESSNLSNQQIYRRANKVLCILYLLWSLNVGCYSGVVSMLISLIGGYHWITICLAMLFFWVSQVEQIVRTVTSSGDIITMRFFPILFCVNVLTFSVMGMRLWRINSTTDIDFFSPLKEYQTVIRIIVLVISLSLSASVSTIHVIDRNVSNTEDRNEASDSSMITRSDTGNDSTEDKGSIKKQREKKKKSAFTDGILNGRGKMFDEGDEIVCGLTTVRFNRTKIKRDMFFTSVIIGYEIRNTSSEGVDCIFDTRNMPKNYIQKGEKRWTLEAGFPEDKDFLAETESYSKSLAPGETKEGTLFLVYDANLGDGDDYEIRPGDRLSVHLLYYENGNEWDLWSEYKF